MQKYQNNVQAISGQAIPGASVTVKTYPDGTLATIYSQNGSGVIAQPLVTDKDGEFSFYAANGRYQLSINGGHITPPQNIVDILLFDPNDADAISSENVSFTQSGTGAVARTAKSKLLEIALSPEDFGAVGDGATLDTTAVQSALNAVSALGGGKVVGRKKYRIGNITIPSNVTLEGPVFAFGEKFNAGGTDFAYDQIGAGVLFLDGASTITLSNAAGIRGWYLLNDNLRGALPPADYAAAQAVIAGFSGTAITQSAASNPSGGDGVVEDMFILGFNQAFYSNNKERVFLRRIKFDCTNGPSINNLTDVPVVSDIHGWPFLIAHTSLQGAHPDLACRTGTGLQVGTEADALELHNVFTFGYKKGIIVQAPIVTTLLNCQADGNPALINTTVNGQTWQPVGVSVLGNADKIKLQGGSFSGQYQGLYVNLTSGAAQASVIGANFHGNYADIAIDAHQQMSIGGCLFGYGAASGPCSIVFGSTPANIGLTAVFGNEFGSRAPFNTISDAGLLGRISVGINQYQTGNGTDTAIGERRSFDRQFAQLTNTYFGTSGTGMANIGQSARGTSYAPAAANDGDVAVSYSGQLFTGSAFSDAAKIRFQAQGASSSGSTPGKMIFSTTPNGSTGLVDRLVLDAAGILYPVADNTYNLGLATNRWAVGYFGSVTATNLTATGTVAGAFSTVTDNGGNSSSHLTITNTNSNGANLRLVGNGATTPKKTLRVNGGVLQVLNDAYSAPIMSVDDSGNLTAGAGLSISPATTTTAPAAGGAGALPATPTGYATITIGGVARKVAYY